MTPDRLGALRRFAFAITLLNVLGHAFFGFEPSLGQPLVAVACAYLAELLLEVIDARATGRSARISVDAELIDFLLPAHITAMAIGMLLYPGARIAPVIFATVAGIASKHIFRITCSHATRHFMNPSNFGIAFTLLLFPSVGISAPYQFTENTGPSGDLLLPMVIILTGTFLNARFAGRLPTSVGWVAGFALQALVRSKATGVPATALLAPATGLAFLLFTFYMITDPGTTPVQVRRQLAFGFGTACVYGLLTAAGVAFGMFFALVISCAVRGTFVWLTDSPRSRPDVQTSHEGLKSSLSLALPRGAVS